MKKVEKEFLQISEFIDKSRNAAVGFMNYAAVSTYWAVGAFVSSRLKSAAWGSKTVVELGDYLKTRNPKLKGFGRRQIYNMVEFYETYSSAEFTDLYERLKLGEFVSPLSGQIVQSKNAQLETTAQIVHFENAQTAKGFDGLPPCTMFLAIINFTNHVLIMNDGRRVSPSADSRRGDEEVFGGILYFHEEG